MKKITANPPNQHILTEVWQNDPEIFNFDIKPVAPPALEKIFADFFSVGKYYYYVLSIAESTISHHHENILEMHGLKEYPQTLTEIINLIHPDDIPFVIEAEKMSYEKVKSIGRQHFPQLKTSYCFRMKTATGSYELFHHQALHTLQSESGQILQAVNIHTNIHHLTQKNPYTVLVSGLEPRRDFHQMHYNKSPNVIGGDFVKLTQRETEILSLIARGYSGSEIAKNICISEHTVKSHRRNIIAKMRVRNTKELISKAIEMAVI